MTVKNIIEGIVFGLCITILAIVLGILIGFIGYGANMNAVRMAAYQTDTVINGQLIANIRLFQEYIQGIIGFITNLF